MNKVTFTLGMFKRCDNLTSIYVTNCDESTIEKIKKSVKAAHKSESIIKTTR